MKPKFQLGDTVVVMGNDSVRSYRKPKQSGYITAITQEAVRIQLNKKWFHLGPFKPREKWFPISNHWTHITSANDFV